MFLFVHTRNYRQKSGYFFVFLTNFMFLMLPLFLTSFIFPTSATAQYGTISGRVYLYSSPSSGLQGVSVAAYDTMGYQMGSDITDSNGQYTITDLSTGDIADYYRVCAVKSGYVRECYQRPDSSCSGRDCGYPWEEDPTETQGSLVDLKTKSSETGINFYLVLGGKIEGNISGANSNYAYRVVFEGVIEYKNRGPLPNREIPLVKTNNHFFNDPNIYTIPPGTYTLRVEDISKPKDPSSEPYTDIPYYTTVYYDGQSGTYSPQEAINLTYLLDITTNKTANFTIRRAGIIWGQVFERIYGLYEEINDARVTATESSLGLPPFWDNTKFERDPNGVYYEGIFYLLGLPPGEYILRTTDTPIPEEDKKIYLPQFYDGVYFADQATPIIINEEDINEPDYKGTPIYVILQHGPVIRGCAMDKDTSSCSLNQYDPNDGLTGITIELIPDFQSDPTEPFRKVQTDPNGYIFKKSEKILEGQYKIRAIDTNFEYFPTDYKMVTVAPGGEYEVNFCMEKVPAGQGNGNISGHLFQDENPDNPLPGIKILLLNKTSGEDQEMITNNYGEYFFNDIEPGEYILFTIEQYGDLILEIFKDVSILDPTEFIEGEIIEETYSTEATAMFLLPGENITNIDIGISTYKYTFGSGLNLFGYPGHPVSIYNDSHKFCRELGTEMHNFRWKNNSGQWEVTKRNLSNPNQPLGDIIDIYTGRGFLIYMSNNKGPIFFPPFKTQPPSVYDLVPGKNFISYPSSLHRPIKKSSELLTTFGTPDEVANAQSFDNTSGKWKSTVWMWGKPSSGVFPINQGEGFVVEMRVPKEVETDEPNI